MSTIARRTVPNSKPRHNSQAHPRLIERYPLVLNEACAPAVAPELFGVVDGKLRAGALNGEWFEFAPPPLAEARILTDPTTGCIVGFGQHYAWGAHTRLTTEITRLTDLRDRLELTLVGDHLLDAAFERRISELARTIDRVLASPLERVRQSDADVRGSILAAIQLSAECRTLRRALRAKAKPSVRTPLTEDEQITLEAPAWKKLAEDISERHALDRSMMAAVPDEPFSVSVERVLMLLRSAPLPRLNISLDNLSAAIGALEHPTGRSWMRTAVGRKVLDEPDGSQPKWRFVAELLNKCLAGSEGARRIGGHQQAEELRQYLGKFESDA